MTDVTALGTSPAPPSRDPKDQAIWKVAQDLEATFLAEMLKSAGFGAARDSFGGGVGEEQFSSFLRQAQAEEMVKTGGIGLAEAVFNTLKERTDGAF
ncbi:MAG: rod-binding protein [Paracoccaceae bacterium]